MSEWIVEAVLQFVNSPLWNVPVNNFIDDKCVSFDQDDGEMKLEYTLIYKEFQVLTDGLLSSFIDELGVPTEEVIAACRARGQLEDKHQIKGATNQTGVVTVNSFLDYIIYLSDFASFKKLMERRNVELDIEASKAMGKMLKGGAALPPPPTQHATAPPTEESEEERDLRIALQLSMQDVHNAEKEAELQDADLQVALALSLAYEKERAQRQAEELEAEMRALALQQQQAQHNAQVQQQAQEMHAKQQQLVAIEAEKKRKMAELEQQALQDRMANLAVHAERATAVAASSPVYVAPTQAPVASQPVILDDVVRISSQPDISLPQPGGLAPLARKGTFGVGFKALPSIQPTFKELNSAMVHTTHTAGNNSQTVAPLPMAPVISETKEAMNKEEMESRAAHMREQRRLMVEQRKVQRASELASYSNNAGGAVPSAPLATAAQPPTEDRQKQLTVEIARRFREDIVGEVRRQQKQDA